MKHGTEVPHKDISKANLHLISKVGALIIGIPKDLDDAEVLLPLQTLYILCMKEKIKNNGRGLEKDGSEAHTLTTHPITATLATPEMRTTPQQWPQQQQNPPMTKLSQ
uniref:Uncharacterized protein n=1 Tax=Setaria digitata TaxID=48799 RepID=A0A915PDG8_9BILA